MFKKIPTWAILFFSFAFILGCNDNAIPENKVFAVKDLAHKKVGVQIGDTADIYASDFGGDTAKIQVERYSKLTDAIQALSQGKIDAVLCDDQPAKAFLRQNPTLKILDEVFVEETYAGVIAKNNTALLDTVNMALKSLKNSGTYDSIFNTYIISSNLKACSKVPLCPVQIKSLAIILQSVAR